jgi:hypothetical protein
MAWTVDLVHHDGQVHVKGITPGVNDSYAEWWPYNEFFEHYLKHPQLKSIASIQKFADWGEIMDKAQRLRNNNQVKILRNDPDHVVGEVQGDHDTYQTEIWRDDPQSQAITMWDCDCPWSDYSWGRTRQWKKFEGRPCAHTLALFWEAQRTPVSGEEQVPAQAPPTPLPGGDMVQQQGLIAPVVTPSIIQPVPIQPQVPPLGNDTGTPLPEPQGPAGPPAGPPQPQQPSHPITEKERTSPLDIPGAFSHVAAIYDGDSSVVDPRPPYDPSLLDYYGEWQGCFGWVDGDLYIGEQHHAIMIAQLIQTEKYDWQTLSTAKQMWGWFNLEDRSDDSDDYSSWQPLKGTCTDCGAAGQLNEDPSDNEVVCKNCGARWYPGEEGYPKVVRVPKQQIKRVIIGSIRFATDDAMQSKGVKQKVIQSFKEAFPFVAKWEVPTGTGFTTQKDYGGRAKEQYLNVGENFYSHWKESSSLKCPYDDTKLIPNNEDIYRCPWCHRSWLLDPENELPIKTEYFAKISKFINGDKVRAKHVLTGIEPQSGTEYVIPQNTSGEVLYSDDDETVVIFPLKSGPLGPHLVKVEEGTDDFYLDKAANPFIKKKKISVWDDVEILI